MSSSPALPVLVDDVVEEILLRLPPAEPAWLVRSSAVCKPWRHLLAAPYFRRRYCEFHGAPPVLGLLEKHGDFIPTSSLFLPDLPNRWVTLDCRHGRALFSTKTWQEQPWDLIVLDPATGQQRRVPTPFDHLSCFSAAVLCAAQGCDHHDCQGGNFFVALVTTDKHDGVTSGWLYSAESHVWSELTSVQHPNVTSGHHPNVRSTAHIAQGSVLVGDALYFDAKGIIEYQVGTLRLSVFAKPIDDNGNGTLMTAEGGVLGFAAVVDVSNLTLWSRVIGSKGSMGWEKIRVIDLKTTLSGVLKIPNKILPLVAWRICCFAEGTQTIFVKTCHGSCMVDLKSGKVRMLSCYEAKLFPYMRFPAMEAASTGQGQ
ncbi:unnamed protein product [Alopecurus aequalis]